jgi:hypothetical protein
MRERNTRSHFMSQLPEIVEHTLQIAWDFLQRSGEISNEDETEEFLLANIRIQMLRGERRPLLVANRAIDAFRRRPIRLVA